MTTEQEWLGNTTQRIAVAVREPVADIFSNDTTPLAPVPIIVEVDQQFDPRTPRRRRINYTTGPGFPAAARGNLLEQMSRDKLRLEGSGFDAVFFLNGERVMIHGR